LLEADQAAVQEWLALIYMEVSGEPAPMSLEKQNTVSAKAEIDHEAQMR
jgi:hypothetical protein